MSERKVVSKSVAIALGWLLWVMQVEYYIRRCGYLSICVD